MSNGDKRPRGIKPVQRIELPASYNKWLRIGAIVLCLIVAAVALGAGLTDLLNKDTGWKTIEVNTTELNCSRDFVLNYDLGSAGISATAEYKKLEALYTQAVCDAYRIFQEDQLGVVPDVAYLNANVNQIVQVDPVLYEAFGLLEQYENRCVYMAPVYVEYSRIFRSESEVEARSFDPAFNQETADYIQQLLPFINSREHIRVELLGENQVRLYVSDAYMAFAEANEITEFLKLGWMKNAFIADYLAQCLIDGGFTNGYLVSYDGFTRNLDSRGLDYSFNLFHRLGNEIRMPAVMQYQKPTGIVFLRDYPLYADDVDRYYTYSDGRIVSAYLRPADGQSERAVSNLVAYSGTEGCARVLLELLPQYFEETLSEAGLNGLTESGIYSVWFAENQMRYNDPALQYQMLSADDGTYTAAYAGN